MPTLLNLLDLASINQQGYCEKAHQIALMSDIYANADATFCCIGDTGNERDIWKLQETYKIRREHLEKHGSTRPWSARSLHRKEQDCGQRPSPERFVNTWVVPVLGSNNSRISRGSG